MWSSWNRCLLCYCFVPVQEEDHVPEDRGPIQDLRELERLDQVHDAGDHPQRDRHVGTHTHTHSELQTQLDACSSMSTHAVCLQGHDDDGLWLVCYRQTVGGSEQGTVWTCVISARRPFQWLWNHSPAAACNKTHLYTGGGGGSVIK